MRKLFTMLSAVLVLTLCMTLTVFADDTAVDNTETITEEDGEIEIEVDGTYFEGYTADEKISVSIQWGNMTFTYHAAVDGTWNEETHTFDNPKGAYWDCDENANKITVTNHSNTEVEAQFTFTATEGLSVDGQFTDSTGAEDYATVELDTAVGTPIDGAPTVDVYFEVTEGSTITAPGILGTVTVKIVNV